MTHHVIGADTQSTSIHSDIIYIDTLTRDALQQNGTRPGPD